MAFRQALAVCVLAGALAACGGSSHAPAGTGAGGATGDCTIPVVEGILNESAAADQRQTSSWTLLQANNWTVFVPNGSWHLSASTAGGADVLSPDGGSDASLGTTNQQAPSPTAVIDHLLGAVSNRKTVCMTGVERGRSGASQAEEVTGVYQGQQVHAIVIGSVIGSLSTGETRSLYTPVSQWSTSAVQTLTLVIKRAIFKPSALP